VNEELQELLNEMQSLLRGQHGNGWDARAVNCSQYAHGDTPAEAMRKAIAFRDNVPAPLRRRVLL
jgi:hypothetical protein